MAKQVLIRNPHDGHEHPYTIIESLEDIGIVPCLAPEADLVARFNEGRTIIVNPMGGYCFLEEDYHVIVGTW